MPKSHKNSYLSPSKVNIGEGEENDEEEDGEADGE
jgi:hypothetical protein